MSALGTLNSVVRDEIFALNLAFNSDDHPQKVNLSVGAYRSDSGKPWPLPAVQEAEKQLFAEANAFRHEYTTIAGDAGFLEAARDLMFGFDNLQNAAGTAAKLRISSVQTVAGTGANHLGALFLSKYLKPQTVWLSDPTWANHYTIWDLVKVPYKMYPYYSASDGSFDFHGMMSTLESDAQPGDIILLQACAHNPTGLDPSPQQWKDIANLCDRKHLFPFIDAAYQGFATGCTNNDNWIVRYFLNKKPHIDMCVAQSFSKNLGLYGQRVGAFHYVLNEDGKGLRDTVTDHLCQLIRGEYTMGPVAGSDIVKRVLTNPVLRAQWFENMRSMSFRIVAMRKALFDELTRLKTPGSWKHITEMIGMFSYIGLSPTQVEVLKTKYHIYLLQSSRASMSGLNSTNVIYVARAIDETQAFPDLSWRPLPPRSGHPIYHGLEPGQVILPKGTVRFASWRSLPVDTEFNRDVPVVLRDGVTIYLDVFRPTETARSSPPYTSEANMERRGQAAYSSTPLRRIGLTFLNRTLKI
ncbi:aspartate transaminase [Aspergillus ustus]|uniref:L-tyrosine:2-oxoglutarate aminotransferase ucdG n=1 Tax=Aspergillus ustus TaxID=40382 RepID=UCDG_ASPUT|nr:aspartate transaminase [Aspergillus ustus]